MGVAPGVLDKQRSMVAGALRILPSESLSAALLLEPLAVDPIYLAIVPLVYNFCRFAWGARVSLHALAAAFEVLQQRDRDSTSIRWCSVSGPLQATFLSLRRIGWKLETYQGDEFELLQVAPQGSGQEGQSGHP